MLQYIVQCSRFLFGPFVLFLFFFFFQEYVQRVDSSLSRICLQAWHGLLFSCHLWCLLFPCEATGSCTVPFNFPPCLPSKDHPQSPLYEGNGVSLLHSDCLLWPVPSAGPKGQPKGSASFPSIKKCLQIQTTPLYFFSGHICFQISVWNIIVVLCCTTCGDSCWNLHKAVRDVFFRDCLLEQLSTPLRSPTALCRCGFPCYITESIWPFGCPTSKHRVSSVEISALFSYSNVESVKTTKKKKHFYSAENLTISRLAFCTLCYL